MARSSTLTYDARKAPRADGASGCARGMVFGRLRCGCYLLMLLVAATLLAAAVVLWLVTREIGPTFSGGAYTVQAPRGAMRTDRISAQAADRFEAKVPAPAGTLDVGRLGVADLARLRLSGITFSEEEVNSELARRLAAQPVQGDGVNVDRLFLELHPQDSRAYLYTRVYGVKITFSARVSFSVRANQARAALTDIHAGKLPIGLILPELLDWTGNTAALENRLALALPKQVTAIQTREGELHVEVDPLRFGLELPAAPVTKHEEFARLAAVTRPGAYRYLSSSVGSLWPAGAAAVEAAPSGVAAGAVSASASG